LLGSLDQDIGELGDILATLLPLLGSLPADRSEQRPEFATSGDKLGESLTELGERLTELGERLTELGERLTEGRSLSRLSAMWPSL
jgi:hypothetical protein